MMHQRKRQQSAKPDVAEDVNEDLPEPDVNKDVSEDIKQPKTGSTLSPRNKAMNLLARREHSQAELRTKLAAREYSPEEIEATVTTLVADGLLSDERFTEAYIAARTRTGQGPVRIRGELKQRGVDARVIGMYLDDVAVEWHGLACEVRSKKFGEGVPTGFKEKAKQMRFLEYRGFTSEQIRVAMGDV
ncbi:MAG: regulatory protein RecX [Gammaproteobacteria bacterium]|nr:regulatory protein RecX [Gammaproteobacteria bacterium]